MRSPLGLGLGYPAASRPAAVGCIHASGASGEGPDEPIRGIHASGASGEGPDGPAGVIHSSDAYRSGQMAVLPVTDALGAWVTTPQRGHRPALDHPCGRSCVACMHGSDRDGDPDLACTPRMADHRRPVRRPSRAGLHAHPGRRPESCTSPRPIRPVAPFTRRISATKRRAPLRQPGLGASAEGTPWQEVHACRRCPQGMHCEGAASASTRQRRPRLADRRRS